MNRRMNNTLILLPVLGAFSIMAVQAQSPQQFLPNVENKIQNDINSGAVNPYQATQLQNGANSIQQQEMKDMAKHNGQLTPQEQQRVARETAKLNQAAHQDVRTDNPNMNPNWRPPFAQQPGYNPNWTQQQQQQWQQQQQLREQQWLQNHPNGSQSNENPRRHLWNRMHQQGQ